MGQLKITITIKKFKWQKKSQNDDDNNVGN